MKKCALWISCAILCMFLISCSSYEGQANKAYNQSKNAQGYDKKILEKRAYIFYQKVLKQTPNKKKLNPKMLSHFVEITLNRAYMVLNEGSYDNDAIHLFMQDIDSTLTKESPANLRQRYIDFLTMMADSCLSRSQVDESLKWLTKAMNFSDNPASLEAKKKLIIDDNAKQFFALASDALKQSKEEKDPELAVKAEYYVLMAMVYDPKIAGAAALLSELRKININTYSGYAKPLAGTKLDKRANKFDILLAVAKTKAGYTVCMFNDSYNPQRLRSENFFLVDDKGTKFKASPSSKIEPEILDTQHETKTLKLSFPGGPANPKKLVYDNGEHHTEKEFY